MAKKSQSKSSKNKAIVIGAVALLIITGVYYLVNSGDNKNKSVSNKTDSSTENATQDNESSNIDGGVKFVVNKSSIKTGVKELNNGLMPASGNQFVTLEVQATNTKSEEVPMFATEQIMTTSNGKLIPADAGLQRYIDNGTWYEAISANGSVTGTLVFEIPGSDSPASITMHVTPGGAGVTTPLE